VAGPVLVADPDTHSRTEMAALLRRGYLVTEALDNLDKATVLDRAGQADLILLPVTDAGLTALKALRKSGTGWTVPILGYANGEIPEKQQLEWFRFGADDMVPVAFDGGMLLARAEGLVRYKRGNDRLQMAVSGFCDARKPRQHMRPATTWATLPMIDFDPSAARAAPCRSQLPDADMVSDPDVLLERLHIIPDALVHLRLRDPEQGLQLIPQIRADAARQYLPLLVHVDEGAEHLARKALDLGASDVVVGDVKTDILRARLDACDRRRFSAAELQASILDQLRLTMVDPLSGLYNRRYVDRYGPAALVRSGKATQSFALIMLDIDRFKDINDRHGHACGDRVISVISRRISRAVRAEDIAARVGGEEFLVILPETDSKVAEAIANRIRHAISRTPVRMGIPGQAVDVTVSVGVSVVEPGNPVSFSEALSMADRALYQSKTAGRDRTSLQSCGTAA